MVRKQLKSGDLRIVAKRWFPACHDSGTDVETYDLSSLDCAAMDDFYRLGIDGSGYDEIPDASYDFIILNHGFEPMFTPEETLFKRCAKLKPSGCIWLAFPSVKSLSLPSAQGTLHFCDDPTHVFVPQVREVANILLKSQIRGLYGGCSKDLIRWLVGVAILPFAMTRKALLGSLSATGLWYVFGFEDCLFRQRRESTNSPHAAGGTGSLTGSSGCKLAANSSDLTGILSTNTTSVHKAYAWRLN